LYEDNLHLKDRINLLKKQKKEIKANCEVIKVENKRLQKMFSHVSSFELGGKQSKSFKMQETYHILQLKKALKETKQELQKQKNNNKRILKNTKHTRIQELEVLDCSFVDGCF